MGSLRVGHDWATSLSRIGEGNGNPLQCSYLENPRDGGAWWLPSLGSHRVWTWLKWLSSSSPIFKIERWVACVFILWNYFGYYLDRSSPLILTGAKGQGASQNSSMRSGGELVGGVGCKGRGGGCTEASLWDPSLLNHHLPLGSTFFLNSRRRQLGGAGHRKAHLGKHSA